MYADTIRKNHRFCRLLAALMCVMLLLTTLPVFERSAKAASDGMVRVRISNLSTAKSVSFTTTCDYYINGNPANTVAAGKSFTVVLSDGTLKITSGGETRAMGTSFSLTRSKAGAFGVKATSPATSNLLCGDLLFSVSGSNIQTVLRIYVEDYLYGVVAYEMSNSFPLEALKAQAVAARNYVLRQKAARTSKSYDVVDGANDQVFRGYVSSYTRVIQAVNETRGVVLYAGSSLAACFYSASNGGQTEATKNIWGSNLSYSIVKDDKYDLESAGKKKTAVINKDASGLNANLKAALISGMADDLEAAGLSTDAADISIDRIVSLTPHTPKYAAPSRLYKKITFLMDVTGKDASGKSVSAQVSADVDTYGGLESWYSLSLNSSSNEVVSVEETDSAFNVVFRRWGHGVGLSQRGAQVMAANYGMSVKEILEFYFPGTTYKMLSLADTTGTTTNGSGGEIVDGGEGGTDTEYEVIGTAKVVLSSDSSTLTLRAGASASTTSLAKLPNGAILNVYAVQDGWAAVDYNGTKGFVSADYIEITYLESATPTPEASATPEPTADPAAKYVQVKLSSTTGSMYIRKGPSTSTTAVTTVKHGAYLEVLGEEGEWSNVRTQTGHEGYIKTKYLVPVVIETTPAPAATATPTPAPTATPTPVPTSTPETADLYAKVYISASGGSMNVRKGPSTSTTALTVVKHGATVQVLGKDGEWSKVLTQSGVTGYIKTKYLVFAAPTATPAPTATATPTPTATPAPVPTATPTPKPTATPTPVPTATPEPEEEAMYAKVKLASASGSMYIRKGPSTSTTALTTVKHGAVLQVFEADGEWSKVLTTSGVTGYIKTKYLVPVAAAPAATPTPEPAATAAPTPKPTATPTPVPTATPEPEDEDVYARVVLSSSSGSMNIRKSATTSSAVVTTVKHGSYLQVLETGEEWCRVMTKSGKTGYIKTKYLVEVSAQEATGSAGGSAENGSSGSGSGDVVEANFTAQTTGSVNLRAKASTSSTSLGVLAKGTKVTVLAYNDEWAYVQYGSKNGFISRKYLKAV